MKYFYLILLVIFFGCGGSNDNIEVEPPVATNDTAMTLENTLVSIDVLANDVLKNNASLNDYDEVSTNNGSIIKASNRLIYTPVDNFIGTDTFTYTICDQISTPNCSTATVTITVTDTGNPLAVNDALEVMENTTTVIATLLENDTLVDDAILTSVDSSSSSGTVVLNTDNTITYTAINGFTGDDTFTYTLCDNDPTPSCATATVTITVTDEGNPVANADEYNVIINTTTVFSEILVNDSVVDDAILSSIDDAATQGSIVLNTDNTITYIPLTDFLGQDTFTYTLCDDDTPSNTCSTATVTITVLQTLSFNIPAPIANYYTDVVFTTDPDLIFEEIEDVTKSSHTSILSYGQRHNYLYIADADLANNNNVILMYTGESRYSEEYTSGNNSYSPQTFNTEHVYPQSLYAGGDGGAAKDEIVKGDLHHLRSCDAGVNSERLNYPFTDGSGTNIKVDGNKWYPGDEWKGDVARMMMYLSVRYGEDFSNVGNIDLFVKWNIEDPVSAFEEQRNEVIYAAQGNRNPFIDNPYLATLIWGGDNAENKWQ